FFLSVPIALAAATITLRHVDESKEPAVESRPDIAGAVTITLGLAGVIVALIEGPSRGWTSWIIAIGIAGVVLLAVFVLIEL
ncbi:MFS transporter, partial [Mycobacterium tuberculosis]|nr:MFS transporter [Mycobacterium tuberculosis]